MFYIVSLLGSLPTPDISLLSCFVLVDNLKNYLLEYFSLFGGNACCFSDSSKYIQNLLELTKDREELLNLIWSTLGLPAELNDRTLHHYTEVRISKHLSLRLELVFPSFKY